MNAAIGFLAREIPGWVLQATWQGTALAAVIWTIQRCLGAQLRARWRNALWLVVMARLLLPVLPQARISVYNWVPARATEVMAPEMPKMQTLPLPAGRNEKPAERGAQPIASSAAPLMILPDRSRAPWPALPWLWLCGMAIFGGVSLARHVRVRRCLARLRLETPPDLLREFDAAKQELGVRGAGLMVSEGASAPCVMGLWRATVLLPAGIENKLEPADLRMVFLHELAHVKRGDLWMAWAGWLAGVLHWFNPAAPLIQRLARRDREMACDEWVLKHLENPAEYGEALVRFLGFNLRPEPGTIGIVEGKAALMQRIRRIAGYHRPTVIGTLAGCALLAIIGAVSLTAADKVAANDTNQASAPLELPLLPDEMLVQAINTDDTAMAEKALGAGAKLDTAFEDWSKGFRDQKLPLIRAASGGHLDMVKLLVARGASVVAGTTSQTNPLEAALMGNHMDVAEYLHDQGTAIDPLTYAAATGDVATVKSLTAGDKPKTLDGAANAAAGCGQTEALGILIDQGANVARAFRRAASNGEVNSLKYLAAHGADLNAVGFDALCRAATSNQPDAVAYLLQQKVDPNTAKKPGDPGYDSFMPVLYQAASVGALGSVKALLEGGADPNGKAADGSPVLSAAVQRDNAEVAALLLDHGANIEGTDARGDTAILDAAGGAPRCLKLFIDRGANLNPPSAAAHGGSVVGQATVFTGEDSDRPGITEFESQPGVLNRSMACVQVLLDAGLLDINKPVDKFGNTPFTTAIANGQTAMVEMYLKRGANVNYMAPNGKTPLIIALMVDDVKEDRYYAVLNELVERGADPNLGIDNPQGKGDNFTAPSSALKTAMGTFAGPRNQTIARRRKLTAMMLAHGARFPVAQGSDTEKLQLAAVNGDRAGVQALLAGGVSPNMADSKGWTPLLTAMALGYDGIFEDLIKAGADPNTHDSTGSSALQFAAEKLPDASEVDMLLDKGADINAAGGTQGEYPILYRAICSKSPDLVRDLLKRGANPNMLPLPEEITQTWFSPLEETLVMLSRNPKDEKLREIVSILIAAGAQTNPAHPTVNSLLIYPVMTDDVDTLKILLMAGVDPNKDPDGGKKVAEEAQRRGNKEIQAIIQQALAKN